jgi:hypothetical protein
MSAAARKPAEVEVLPTDAELELHKETVKDVAKQYRGIDFVPETWEDIAEAFDGEILDFQGSPWKVVDKETLIGVPFMIADTRFYWSEKYDNPVVSLMVLTKDNEKLVINDGSTGIMEQVRVMLQASGRKSGILCSNGLRKSEYTVEVHDPFEDETKTIQAATYYIA